MPAIIMAIAAIIIPAILNPFELPVLLACTMPIMASAKAIPPGKIAYNPIQGIKDKMIAIIANTKPIIPITCPGLLLLLAGGGGVGCWGGAGGFTGCAVSLFWFSCGCWTVLFSSIKIKLSVKN